MRIALELAPETSAPGFVKFQMRELGEAQPDEFGPFDINAIPDEQFSKIKPGTLFYIDVIGCPDGDPATCIDPGAFNARGCTEFISLERDANEVIVIVLHNAVEGDALCPPAEPAPPS